MRIGIDISQIVYEGTGVASYVKHLVRALVSQGTDHEYILFGASLRQRDAFAAFVKSLSGRVRLVSVPIPPTMLALLWNRLHIIPVEWFTGPLDVFYSSDWTQPPLAHAKGVTTIHDLIVLKFPQESHASTEFDAKKLGIIPNIVATQKQRLTWVVRECRVIFCDSESTKRDVMELLRVTSDRLRVVYPGFTGGAA